MIYSNGSPLSEQVKQSTTLLQCWVSHEALVTVANPTPVPLTYSWRVVLLPDAKETSVRLRDDAEQPRTEDSVFMFTPDRGFLHSMGVGVFDVVFQPPAVGAYRAHAKLFLEDIPTEDGGCREEEVATVVLSGHCQACSASLVPPALVYGSALPLGVVRFSAACVAALRY